MANVDTGTLWLVIVALGVGTYLIRFSFLGIVGNRPIPEWVQRHLRYVAVAVLPALITPLVIWPPATGGETDPARLVAALAAFAVGMRFNSVMGAVGLGMATLYGMQYLLG
ncbi:AzlD domain-containing protein [Simiduia sp. 21SJ11W-1]|uniref:AzlD domain-containing protein n=1 Tax=Simiduia sp. 21SJ11W-1 TaxID=2909669 RepID=UPI00209CECCF|nr:AzlD domain-containing protein [Simiduia sp. 21SJ11W-1]UTA48641.1 AzlD domain-containing protein [Simiduia sp. 21SJ11W-1]